MTAATVPSGAVDTQYIDIDERRSGAPWRWVEFASSV